MKRLAWLVLILVVELAGGCDWNAPAKQVKIKAEKERRWQSGAIDLAKKHNAISDWEAQIPKRGWFAGAFSIDVSKALIQSSGRPVLLVMDLKDVAEGEGSYIARFSGYGLTNRFFELSLELKCTREQANQLLGTGTIGRQRCAVIARITEVSRPRFEVSGTVDGGDEYGTVTGVELDYSPATFHAKGECLDLLRKGEI